MTLFLYFSRISMGQYCLKMLWKVRSLEERYNGGFTIYGKFSIEEGHSFLLLPSPYGQNLPPGTSFAPSRVSYFGATTFVKTVGDLTIWLAENGEKHYLGCYCKGNWVKYFFLFSPYISWVKSKKWGNSLAGFWKFQKTKTLFLS